MKSSFVLKNVIGIKIKPFFEIIICYLNNVVRTLSFLSFVSYYQSLMVYDESDIRQTCSNLFCLLFITLELFFRFFRVIPAESYLETFSSDRRHMRRPDGSWIKPPPQYEPIQTMCKLRINLFFIICSVYFKRKEFLVIDLSIVPEKALIFPKFLHLLFAFIHPLARNMTSTLTSIPNESLHSGIKS